MVAIGGLAFGLSAANAATFTVISADDGSDAARGDGICDNGNGECTLRAALEEANDMEGTDTISFSIGDGSTTIRPTFYLPEVTDPIIIDGYSQPGAQEATAASPATLLIELSGDIAGDGASGLVLAPGSKGSIIRGLAINGFNGFGIWVRGSDNNAISGNHIGTSLSGNSAEKNWGYGVQIMEGASNNTVGGSQYSDRNVISGNAGGVMIDGPGSTNNVVSGNYIGTDATGTVDLGNDPDCGVRIQAGSSDNVIGGETAAERNVISGNEHDGIYVTEVGTTGNQIVGNYVGTDVSGTIAVPNTYDGIAVNYGSSGNTLRGNVFSGNLEAGIMLDDGHDNLFFGNYIGVDATGTVALPNPSGLSLQNYSSGNVVGGNDPGQYNVISGNDGGGLQVLNWEGQEPPVPARPGNRILGNHIGVDATGLNYLGNAGDIVISNADDTTISGPATWREMFTDNARVDFVDMDLRSLPGESIVIENTRVGLKNSLYSEHVFKKKDEAPSYSTIRVFYRARAHLPSIFAHYFGLASFKMVNSSGEVMHSGGFDAQTGHSAWSEDYLFSHKIDQEPQSYQLKAYKNGRLRHQSSFSLTKPDQTVWVGMLNKPPRLIKKIPWLQLRK